ncbi:MAG: hypothetical protein ACTSVZ_14450 [Promethearchaeota archaeon]
MFDVNCQEQVSPRAVKNIQEQEENGENNTLNYKVDDDDDDDFKVTLKLNKIGQIGLFHMYPQVRTILHLDMLPLFHEAVNSSSTRGMITLLYGFGALAAIPF